MDLLGGNRDRTIHCTKSSKIVIFATLSSILNLQLARWSHEGGLFLEENHPPIQPYEIFNATLSLGCL